MTHGLLALIAIEVSGPTHCQCGAGWWGRVHNRACERVVFRCGSAWYKEHASATAHWRLACAGQQTPAALANQAPPNIIYIDGGDVELLPPSELPF